MCGIVGVMGDIGFNEKKMFQQMLYVDYLRGVHSTGVARVDAKGEFAVHKRAVNPIDFYDLKSTATFLQGTPKLLIGHNRHATVGKVNAANAHPFEFDNVVGVHNGTLTNKAALEGSAAFDTDSEALYNEINAAESPVETLEKLLGAYALVWYDKRTHELTVARNNERPLSMAFSQDGKTFFFASEPWMLDGIAGRTHVKLGRVSSLSVGKMLKLAVPLGYGRPVLDAPLVEPFTVAVPKLREVTYSTYTRPAKRSIVPATSLLGKSRGDWVDFRVSSIEVVGDSTKVTAEVFTDTDIAEGLFFLNNKLQRAIVDDLDKKRTFTSKVSAIIGNKPSQQLLLCRDNVMALAL